MMQLAFVPAQTSLCLTFAETLKIGFCMMWLIIFRKKAPNDFQQFTICEQNGFHSCLQTNLANSKAQGEMLQNGLVAYVKRIIISCADSKLPFHQLGRLKLYTYKAIFFISWFTDPPTQIFAF